MGREVVANADEAVAVASAYTGEAITVTPAMSASITFSVPRSALAATRCATSKPPLRRECYRLNRWRC